MIKYKNKKFNNYYDVLIYMCQHKIRVNEALFPYARLYYCKAALENKFQRKFKLSEVKELIKDLPQTSSTSNNNFVKSLQA
jgi:hypothetical protein